MLAAIAFWIEGTFLRSLTSRSLLFRLWVHVPAISLGVIALVLTISGAGVVGIPLALAVAALTAEVWIGLSWYHDWIGRRSLFRATRRLDANPELERALRRSKMATLFIRLIRRRSG